MADGNGRYATTKDRIGVLITAPFVLLEATETEKSSWGDQLCCFVCDSDGRSVSQRSPQCLSWRCTMSATLTADGGEV